jgi:hypothetical protein
MQASTPNPDHLSGCGLYHTVAAATPLCILGILATVTLLNVVCRPIEKQPVPFAPFLRDGEAELLPVWMPPRKSLFHFLLHFHLLVRFHFSVLLHLVVAHFGRSLFILRVVFHHPGAQLNASDPNV